MIYPKNECAVNHAFGDRCKTCPHEKWEEKVRGHDPVTGYVYYMSQFWCDKCRNVQHGQPV